MCFFLCQESTLQGKITQLAIVDMQKNTEAFALLHVNCCQLGEYFLQCRVKPQDYFPMLVLVRLLEKSFGVVGPSTQLYNDVQIRCSSDERHTFYEKLSFWDVGIYE